MRQITSNQDKITKKHIINRISDLPGGISLTVADLVVGNVVYEATPVSAPTDGKRTVCKQAILLTGSTTTVFRVESGTHHFKTGEYIMQATGGAAYAGTVALAVGEVDGVTYDTITVGTALESATVGTFIYQSSATGATAGALSNTADAILKHPFEVPSYTEVISVKDVHLRADVVANVIGPLYLATLPGIIEVKR
jgi:hypothetical protein